MRLLNIINKEPLRAIFQKPLDDLNPLPMPIIRRFKVNTDLKNLGKIVEQNQLSSINHEAERMLHDNEEVPINFPMWKRWWIFFKIKF